MSFDTNASSSKKGWEQIKYNVMYNLEGLLGAQGINIAYTNWNMDALSKIDSVILFKDKFGNKFSKNIQFRFWNTNNSSASKDYLTIRTHSWSKSLNKYVPSEFYCGDKIDYFIQGLVDSTGKVIKYIIIDWKNLYSHFNTDIFSWTDSKRVKRSYNTYFYYERELSVDNDSIHTNKMITIPIKKGTVVNNIDKSLENLWPETIILEKEFNNDQI